MSLLLAYVSGASAGAFFTALSFSIAAVRRTTHKDTQ